jgi:putative methyltransferase (TIGR04325 family)
VVDILDTVRGLPGVHQWRMRKYDRRFLRNVHRANLFRGVYDSFAAAVADLPGGSAIGYDQPGTADFYRQFMKSPREWDYPVLYWLHRLGPDLQSVFDHGGHVGILYYALRPYLSVGAGFRWRVQDVPSIVAAGRKLAVERSAEQLEFTEAFNDANGCEVLLSSGSLQYMEQSPVELLASLSNCPKHLIINMLPQHESEEFVTVNSLGVSLCPYKVRHRGRFLRSMEQAGWRLCDEWQNMGKACPIPFHDRFNGVEYYGEYFRRD